MNSSLKKSGLDFPCVNYIGGLGGRDISADEIKKIFSDLEDLSKGRKKSAVHFFGIPEEAQNA